MNFYILLLFFSSTYAIDFDCLKGPTYWCANLENAQKCGRITECFMNNRNVAISTAPKHESTDYCTLCKMVVTELEKEVLPQMTEQQFVNFVVNNICDKLVGEYVALCKTAVSQYGPVIYALLVSSLQPASICSNIGLCTPAARKSVILGSPETCKLCKEVLLFVESVVSSLSDEDLKALLKEVVCHQLPPSYQSMCSTLVDGYADQIFELIKSLLDGDRTCPALHLCSSPKCESVAAWSCQPCVDVVNVLKKDLVNVSTAEVDNLLKTMMCSKVPYLFRSFCNNKVTDLVPEFMNDLHSLTAQQLCAKNQLCATQLIKEPLPEKSTIGSIECDACELVVGEFRKLVVTKEGELRIKNFIKSRVCRYFGKQSQECVNFVDKYGDLLINFINTELTNRQICELFGGCTAATRLSRGMSKVGSLECEACQLILTQVKQFIADPTHQASIKNFLENRICVMFGSDKTKCQQVVEEYFTIIFNAIISELDVDRICQILKFCPVSVSIDRCEVCEVVMKELIDVVTSNESLQWNTNFINTELCPKLGLLKDQCISVVNTYMPFFFKIARESLNSKILCSRLHLCSLVTQKRVESLLKSMEVKSFQCELCQTVIKEVVALLSDNTIQDTLENFLKQEICPYFGSKKQECENDITEYYSFVINIVLQFLTPSLCSDLRLCASSQPMLNVGPPIPNIVRVDRSLKCDLCPKFYKLFKTINEKTSANDIELGVVSLCCAYYHEDKTKCLGELRRLPGLLESFKSAKSEAEFCEKSKMCHGQSHGHHSHRRPCSLGPSFWCLGRPQASLCGKAAVKYCELNAWKANPTL